MRGWTLSQMTATTTLLRAEGGKEAKVVAVPGGIEAEEVANLVETGGERTVLTKGRTVTSATQLSAITKTAIILC